MMRVKDQILNILVLLNLWNSDVLTDSVQNPSPVDESEDQIHGQTPVIDDEMHVDESVSAAAQENIPDISSEFERSIRSVAVQRRDAGQHLSDVTRLAKGMLWWEGADSNGESKNGGLEILQAADLVRKANRIIL